MPYTPLFQRSGLFYQVAWLKLCSKKRGMAKQCLISSNKTRKTYWHYYHKGKRKKEKKEVVVSLHDLCYTCVCAFLIDNFYNARILLFHCMDHQTIIICLENNFSQCLNILGTLWCKKNSIYKCMDNRKNWLISSWYLVFKSTSINQILIMLKSRDHNMAFISSYRHRRENLVLIPATTWALSHFLTRPVIL